MSDKIINFGDLVTVKKDTTEFEDKLVLKRIGYRVHSMVKVKGLRSAYKWYDIEPFDTKDILDTVLYQKVADRLLEDMEIEGVIFEIYRLYEGSVTLFKEIVKTPNLSMDDLRDAYGHPFEDIESDGKKEENKEMEKAMSVV